MKKSFLFRLTACLVLVTFSTFQIAWAQGPVSLQDQVKEGMDPETPVGESSAPPQNPETAKVETSLGFLAQDLLLSEATESGPGIDTGNLMDVIPNDAKPLVTKEPEIAPPDFKSFLDSVPLSPNGEKIRDFLENPPNTELPREKVDLPLSEDPLKDVVLLKEVQEKETKPGRGAVLYAMSEKSSRHRYDRYSFEEALDLLRPEYATAVIVESLSEEDLKSLLELPFEVAIVVLEGEIVLFTTGNEEEIGISAPAKKLLKHAGFISHTHVTESSQEGPSSFDLVHAVRSPKVEHVLTDQGVFAYNRSGILNEGEPYSLEEYLARLHQVLEESGTKNQIKARSRLNEFIREMDLLNEISEGERSIFRAAAVSAASDEFNRTGLGTNWTAVQASFAIDSSQALTHSCCTSPGVLVYNGTLASSDYDLEMDTHIAGSMATRGFLARYQDTSNYYYAKWGRDGDAKIVKRAAGVETVLGIYDGPWATDNTWHKLRFSVEGSSLKFYVDGVLRVSVQDSTFTSGKVGIRSDVYYTRLDNFTVTTPGAAPPLTPPTVNPPPAYTSQTTLTLSGTKPANTSIWINGVERVAANASATWSASVTLASDGPYNFSVTTKGALGNVSNATQVSTTRDRTAPAGAVKINADAASTNYPIVTLDLTATDAGSGVTQMRFSTNAGTTWTAWENFAAAKSITLPTGSGTKEVRYQVKDRAGNTATFTDTISLEIPAAFEESSGLLVIDGEHPHEAIMRNGKNWQLQSSTAGYSGEGYLWAGPDTGTSYLTNFATSSPELRYQVNFQTTGTYYVWLRGWAPNTGGDTVHVGLDGTAPTSSDNLGAFTVGSYSWSKNTLDSVTATLNVTTAGGHTLNIWIREDGFRLDKIILTTDPNFVPSGIGSEESARVGSTVTVNPPTVNALSTYTNSASVALSGTKPANTSIWINGVERVPIDSSTTWSTTEAVSGDGLKTFSFVAKDSTWNQSSETSVSTTLDMTLPGGTVQINSDATYTTSPNIILTLTGSDALSGVDAMHFSTDGGVSWTAWEAVATTKSLTLPAGDATVEVRYELRDKAGNISTFSDTVVLDTISPTGSIDINSGAAYTNQTSVTLNLSVSDSGSGIDNMSFSTDGTNWDNPVVFSSSYAYTLPTGDGTKAVYVRYYDKANNVSQIYSKSIVLDTTLPTGTATIASGNAYTTSTTVQLTLTQTETNPDKMQISVDGGVTWGNGWIDTLSDPQVTLPSGDGTKEVWVEFQDKAGNVSTTVISDTIILDTAAPSGAVLINGGAMHTNNRNITLTLDAGDATSGPDEMRFSLDEGQTWTTWEAVAASKNLTLPAGDGSKTVQYELRDKAGNTTTLSAGIILDTAAPVLATSAPYFDPSLFKETGLFGYWNFDGLSGAAAPDESQSANHGTLQGGVSASAEVPAVHFANSGSLNFDGVNDYVSTSTQYNNPNVFSLSLWFKTTTTTGGKLIGFGKSKTGTSTQYDRHLYMTNTGKIYFGLYPGSVKTLNTAASYNDGQWHHVAASLSSAGMTLYMDGALIASNASVTTAENYAGYWRVGYDNLNGWTNKPTSSYFKGLMDDVHVFSRALSLEEIQKLAGGDLLLPAPPVISKTSLSVDYTADGISKTMSYYGLAEGENELTLSEQDEAGNRTTLLGKVTVDMPDHTVLQDNTELFYVDDAGAHSSAPVREVTPDGDEVFYRMDGSVEKYRYAGGREIRYVSLANVIEIRDAMGTVIETIDRPVPTAWDESKALRLTLDGGVVAYYVNGILAELRTATGIRVTDFTLNAANEIQNALIVYPDKTLEVIRSGVLLRRIYPDGSVMDFTPKGFAVREILKGSDPFWFSFDKISQTSIQATRIFTADGGASSIYDELGILREVSGAQGERFIYSRAQRTDAYTTELVRAMSSSPKAQSLVGATYDLNGMLKEMRLEDGTKILFTNGSISQVLDASGNPVADYDYSDLLSLSVTRSNTQFQYDGSGFLSKVVTATGTITRTAQDTNGNGTLTDEQVVDLLLETVGGDKLTDFELDADGNIIKGIITTKEGIKQRIENGVMTGFETVDGKIYDYAANEAILKAWQFRDGTRVVYGGGTITEILNPDGSRLHTIGFSPEKKVESFTEELPDGTKKYFETKMGTGPRPVPILVKLITPSGAQILYGADGMAEKIVLPDGSEERVEYDYGNGDRLDLLDSQPVPISVTFIGGNTHRTFSPDGTLLNLLSNGVNAEVAAGEISNLFTRFGAVQAPQFSPEGLVTGVLQSTDGTKLQITEGELTQMIRVNGTKVNFNQGRIASIEQGTEIYSIIEQKDANGNVTEIRIRLDSKPGTPEFPLIPFLENPDSLLEYASGENLPDHPVTFHGGASIDTTDKKFGEGSVHFDGSGDYLTLQDSEDFDFETGDFTVDFWVRFDSLTGFQQLYAKGQNLEGDMHIDWQADGVNALEVTMYYQHNFPWVPTLGVWHHVEVLRGNGNLRAFVDGAQIGDTQTNTTSISNTSPVVIGAGSTAANFLSGSIDELKVLKGPSTKLLLHFDPPKTGPTPLSEAAAELADILVPRPLHDAFGDRFNIRSVLKLPGSEESRELFFAKFVWDAERGDAAEFGGEYMPEWLNVSLTQTSLDQGYIGHDIVTGGEWDDFPSATTTLADMNGDGLEDRVFVNPSSDSWWVQMNTGQGFSEAVSWNGVQTLGSWDKERYIRFFIGRHPQEFGQLVDMDGDNLPDRVLQKQTGESEWYVQFNNGSGFDPITLWSDKAQILSIYHPYGHYASKARDNSYLKDIQELVADLIDMDGDGLPDRVVRPFTGPFDRWFFQKNLGKGNGFADTVLWNGVDPTFYSGNEQMGGSLSWYTYAGSPGDVADLSDLVDLTGDGLPDRVLLKNKNSANPNSAMDWYIQKNNGSGFDSAVLWDSDVRTAPGLANAGIATAMRVFKGWNSPRDVVIDLRDVTGDGLVDRVTMDGTNGAQHMSWWVEENTGAGFAPAIEWTGIAGTGAGETSITQDNDNFHSQNPPGSTPSSVKKVSDLVDMNGDDILDRVIFPEGQAKWLVQFGTGTGFLPVQEMQIASLAAPANQVRSSRYDYLHVSLKGAAAIAETEGSVLIELSDLANPAANQSWSVTGLTTSWQDFYLPIDRAKPNAGEVKIRFVPSGADPEIPIYVDGITFTSFRPPAAKDWLDRFLTEENVLSEINSKKTQTLAQYLGYVQMGSDPATFGSDPFWSSLLTAETRIAFDTATSEATQFTTFYGSVSKIAAGQVTETTLPDGTVIAFEAPDAANPQTTTQTLTHSDGTAETNALSYGRVRTVAHPTGSPLQYSYEFNSAGTEITVVFDPDTNITERYIENRLVSRTEQNGVTTQFIYDGEGRHIRTQIIYLNRVRAAFEHDVTAAGYRSVRHEDGVIEEFDEKGQIVAHTTPEGYRYLHSYARARQVVTEFVTETAQLATGTVLEIQVPVVTLVEDPEGETIHRTVLESYRDAAGTQAAYQDGILTSTKDASGLTISFDTVQEIEKTNEQEGSGAVVADGAVTYEITPTDATVFHPDGTVTEFRHAKPFSITTATGRVISLAAEDGQLINPNESAEFHYQQAMELWQEMVLAAWTKYQPSAAQEILGEYTMDGKMLVRQYAEGAIELYGENGRIEEVISREGERLVRYEYDTEGNPTAIRMEGMRRNLEATVARVKADIMVENQKAFKYVEDREQVINQTVEGQYQVALARLLEIRAQLAAEGVNLASLIVGGKKGKQLIGVAQIKLDDGFRLVDQAIAQLAQNRIDALNSLETQVEEARGSITQQTNDAFTRVEVEKNSVLAQIVKQEYLPVIFHWYRKILGRDPSQSEYQDWLDSVNAETGFFDLAVLKNELLTGPEFSQRTSEVQGIKNKVARELRHFLTLSDAEKAQYAALLGIETNLLMPMESAQTESVLAWLMSQGLHFGQSAYLSLEAMLEDAGVARVETTFNENEPAGSITDSAGTYSRLNLATRLILTDILTGTLTPLEKGDLVISLYALKKVAASYGLETEGYKMSYEALRALYEAQCGAIHLGPEPPACDFRFVAHINSNHFIIVTGIHLAERTEQVLKVDENGILARDQNGDPLWEDRVVKDKAGNIIIDEVITFTDPGAGPQGALSIVKSTQEEFMAVWENQNATQPGHGYVLSARGPPAAVPTAQYSALSTQQEMAVRGAFFGWILKLIAKVIELAIKIIEKIVRKIGGIVEGIYDAIADIVSAIFGDAFQALKQGDFFKFHKELWKAGVKVVKASFKAFAAAFQYGFSKEGLLGGFVLGFVSKYVEVFLTELGVSEKTIATVKAGVDIVIGAAAIVLSFGNPLLISFGVAQIAKGVGDLFLLHTDVDPRVVRGFQLGAQVIAAALGQNPASFAEFLKTTAILAAQEFAAAGVVAIGSKIGLDPRLTSLISIPVRAAVGSFTDGLMNGTGNVVGWRSDGTPIVVSSSKGLLDYVKDSVFSSDILSGFIGVGAEWLGDKTNLPSSLYAFGLGGLGDFVNGFFSENGSGGGGGPGNPPKNWWDRFRNGFEGIATGTAEVLNSPTIPLAFAEALSAGGDQWDDLFDRYATSILSRSAIEKLRGGFGSLKDFMERVRLDNITQYDDIQINYDVANRLFSIKDPFQSFDIEYLANSQSLADINLKIGRSLGDGIYAEVDEMGNIIYFDSTNGQPLLTFDTFDDHVPLTYDNLTGVMRDLRNDRAFYLEHGHLLGIDDLTSLQVNLGGQTFDVDVNLYMTRRGEQIELSTALNQLSPELLQMLDNLGKTLPHLAADIFNELSKTQFDTDPSLVALKQEIQNGTFQYADFSNDPTQLAKISASTLNPQILDPNQKAWRTVEGYPIKVEQSRLMKTGLLGGMVIAGESPEGFDELHNDGGTDEFIRDGRGVPLGQISTIQGESAAAVAEALADTQKAILEFKENEIGTYQVVAQYYGSQDNPEQIRYFLVMGSSPDPQTNQYLVVNKAYAENVIVGVDNGDSQSS